MAALGGGCGAEDDRGPENGRRPEAAGEAVDLVITVRRPSGPERARLECGPAEQRAPCETARRLAPFLERKPPRDRICTQIYGGPETARIVGTIGERRVDRRFARSNGCEIADWKRVEPLLRLAAP